MANYTIDGVNILFYDHENGEDAEFIMSYSPGDWMWENNKIPDNEYEFEKKFELIHAILWNEKVNEDILEKMLSVLK